MQLGAFLRDFDENPMMWALGELCHGRHMLLTGGTGFFGKWLLALAEYLNLQGCEFKVTVVSRSPNRFLDLFPEYQNSSWLDWLVSDIRTLHVPPEKHIDLVLHAAADASLGVNQSFLELFETIMVGARRVLDLAARGGGSRILMTGSGAQYGSFPGNSHVTENYYGACYSNSSSSAYGEAKRAQETLGAIYAESHGLDVVLTRCFAFSGPGLPIDRHFAIGNFVRDALVAPEVVVNSSGAAVRSYLHGADLAVWLMILLLKGERGNAYNVGSDQAISVADLARRVISRIAPEKCVRILGKDDGGERSFYVPSISKARSLGLDVWTSLDMSIDSMARFHGSLRS